MTWADYLAVSTVMLLACASWLLRILYLKNVQDHVPPCDCEPCVSTALAMVERDTEKASVKR